MKWRYGSKEAIVLDYYYLRITDTTPDTPKKVTTTRTIKITDSKGLVTSGSVNCKNPNVDEGEDAEIVDYDKMSRWTVDDLRRDILIAGVRVDEIN